LHRCTVYAQGKEATEGSAGVAGLTSAGGEENVSQQVSDIEQQSLQGLLNLFFVGQQAASTCLSKDLEDPVVMGLCRFINATETARLDIGQAVLQDQFGVTFQPPDLNVGGATAAGGTAAGAAGTAGEELSQSLQFWQQALSNLTNLEGQEFEMAFLRFLVLYDGVHIAGSIPCAQSAGRKEILDFCISNIETSTAQLAEVRGYLCGKYVAFHPHLCLFFCSHFLPIIIQVQHVRS
jgi:hypothetical protein